MGSGWAYFVEHDRYIKHVSQNSDDAEVSELPIGIQIIDIRTRYLAVALTFMQSTKRTEGQPKTTLRLASLLAYVHDTPS